MAKTPNPLSRYFRTAALTVDIPTNGVFFDPPIEMNAQNQLLVYPMTGMDEIGLKNPDTLMSGDAISQLIKSCVPAIQNPLEVSMPDMDVILLAIRVASTGEILEVFHNCPHCKSEATYDVDLTALLQTVGKIDPDQHVITENLKINLRPIQYGDAVKVMIENVLNIRMFKTFNDDTLPEVIEAYEKAATARQSQFLMDSLANAIMSIEMLAEEEVIVDRGFIAEFVNNTSRQVTNAIHEILDKMNTASIKKEIAVVCDNPECGKDSLAQVPLDPSIFFE